MILSRAPYRISLGGGGTDLPSYSSRFGGFVLSAAINKYLYVCVNRPAADDLIRLKYSRYEQVSAVEEVQHDLVRHALRELGLGPSLEITSMADVPAGTGLGSSGAYLVALLTALHELKRERVSTQLLAEQACRIELELAGHPVGKHDHYLAAFGGITCLNIGNDGRVEVSALSIPPAAVEEFRDRVLLFYTGVTRSSGSILEAQKRDTERDDESVIESLHRTKELGHQVKRALEAGDVERFGFLLHEHWQNKKRRGGGITDPLLDRWYDLARENGAVGGKLMGAGGGGFFMLFCPRESKQRVRMEMRGAGLRELAYDFDFEGAKVMLNV
jgi:D-glycero-alpha-D-manno-heptose-7-phosphate kinase